MQWVTDGQTPVLSHHSKKNVICISKNDNKTYLSQAAHIGDDSVMSLDVHHQLLDLDRDKIDDRLEGKKYNLGAEFRGQAESQDDDQILQHHH
jgi:hypothetical protein